MPDNTGEVIPAWMFDAAVCMRMRVGNPRVSMNGLAQMRALLNELGFDRDQAGNQRRRENAIDENESSPDPANTRLLDDTADTAAVVPEHSDRSNIEANARENAVVVLARLLLEAAQSPSGQGGSDEAP